MSVTAVPRSGCLAMSRSGMAVKMPPRMRSPVFFAPRRFSAKYIARSSATRNPGELGGLQVEPPDRNPALPAHLRLPFHQHEDQQHEQAAVDEERMLGQHAVVHREADDEREQPEAERVELDQHLRVGAPAGRRVM